MGKRILKQEQEERARLLKYRDRQLFRRFFQRISRRCTSLKEKMGRCPVFMEVSGTHTAAFFQTGLREALESSLDLRSGPGCPVCVIDHDDIDKIIALSQLENVTIGNFGDIMRVPGSYSSLEIEKAKGASVETFYSPSDAVKWAKRNPSRQLIFIGAGFEITASVVALSIQEADDKGVKNFSVLSLHKLIPPVLEVLFRDKELKVDGLILPGHLSIAIGRKAFDFLSEEFNIPGVVAGYEPLDLLGAIDNLTEQLLEGKCRVDNNFTRVVREEGNKTVQTVIKEFYDTADVSWRGFGRIPESGLSLKNDLEKFDASKRFPVDVSIPLIAEGCRCGEVLTGKIVPSQCRLFAGVCKPAKPVGPCMASSMGACSIISSRREEA